MHKRWLCLLTLFVGGILVRPASAQQTAAPTNQPAATPAAAPQDSSGPAAQAPAATPPAAPTWSAGPIDFSGTIDVNYAYDFNNPASHVTTNYNFDDLSNNFSLNFLKLGMSHSPDPVGFEFDLGFGETMNLINASSNSGFGSTGNGDEFDKLVENAYVEWKPTKGKGFELDFGKFVTFAGAEVIESYSNWNYSRSLLFTDLIPYTHTGVRLSWPMGKHWTGGFQVVNGWNNSVDNNAGKTIGVNSTLTYAKWTWAADYYGGPENPGTDKGWRHLFDTTLTLNPSSKVSAYINYDYVQNRCDTGFGCSINVAPGLAAGRGVAGALHIAPDSKWSFTPRIEWMDVSSVAALASLTSPNARIDEFTITAEYKFLEGLLWRGEYRHDWSDQSIFARGVTTPTKSEDTVAVAMIAFFGPKR